MDELIESLKRRDHAETIAQETENKIRLHDAEIIQAKAPDFWAMVKAHLQVLCSELMQAFPNNTSRRAFMEDIPDGFFLNGSGLPRRILSAQLDVQGQRVKMSIRIRQSFEDAPTPQPLPSIDIKVGKNEEVLFIYTGKRHDDPQEVSRALLRYVCGF